VFQFGLHGIIGVRFIFNLQYIISAGLQLLTAHYMPSLYYCIDENVNMHGSPVGREADS
jgi:hypothetical protein